MPNLSISPSLTSCAQNGCKFHTGPCGKERGMAQAGHGEVRQGQAHLHSCETE
jgi:hypothetical protein